VVQETKIGFKLRLFLSGFWVGLPQKSPVSFWVCTRVSEHWVAKNNAE